MESLRSPSWISTARQFNRVIQNLRQENRIAVDTESNSLYAYREQVCLIQISIPGQDFLIDPLANLDLSPLKHFFANPKIEKIFHAAEYDLIGLWRDFDIQVENIFDTMQAARILGYKQVGLDSILANKFGVQVNKRHQKANWGKRPLPSDMLEYACQDSHYLLALRDIFQAELKQARRWDLASEEFKRISHHVNQNNLSEEPPWLRVSGARKLTPRQVAILNELCNQREILGARMNRPVFKVISNTALLNIAKIGPKNLADLEKAGVTGRQIQLFGHEILISVQRGLAAEPLRMPPQRRRNDAFMHRQENLKKWRKRTAMALGIESDLILPKSFLHAIAERNPQGIADLKLCMPDSPWRVEHFGETILDTIKPAR